MADNALTTDRRSFLSGSVSIAAVASIAALPSIAMAGPSSARAEWDAAMAAYLRAKANHDWFAETVHDPEWRRNGRVCDMTNDGMELATDKLCDAENRLMGMPAPDNAALRWKLDIALEDSNGSLNPWTTEYMAQTVRDYRRLLGNA